MSHPHFHARSSARKFGGQPEDYIELHNWFDKTKAAWPDHRHRAILHNSFGIFLAEENWGLRERIKQLERLLERVNHTLVYPMDLKHKSIVGPLPVHFTRQSDQREVPIRIICEQHVEEDLGRIPTIEEWLRELPREKWHGRQALALSREEEECPEKTLGPSEP